jgi:hypothetical protein
VINTIKSVQLSNGDILCLTEENKLIYYEKQIIENFLSKLFMNYYEYSEPINQKENESLDIVDITDYKYPDGKYIFSNYEIDNFIEKVTNDIYIIIYGKKNSYDNISDIFYTDINSIKNNSKSMMDFCSSENLDIYLLVDYNINSIAFNFIKNGSHGIGVINLITKGLNVLCYREECIFNFSFDINNNLFICLISNNILENTFNFYIKEKKLVIIQQKE